MSTVVPPRSRLRTLLLWAAPLTWLGCGGGGGGTDIVLPSLSVSTSTDGVEVDSDGYSLLIDGSGSGAIGVAATVVIDRLPDGQHQVELSGLSSNCATQGENPQSVSVSSGATATVTFAVRCSATSGSIEVATTTSGSGSDPDGFTLLLDATAWGPIGPAATASVDGIAPGAHSVGLTGLAANCQVSGENPRPVAVSPGQTVQVPFSVTCEEPGPSPGTLAVITATTGSNPDADGYGVSLDSGASQPVGSSGSLTLPGLPSGRHAVLLTGIAPNCSVSGANPRTVSIAAGATASVSFAITCTAVGPTTGTLRITAATSGGTPDPDGYTVSVDNGNPQPVGVNGSRSTDNLAAGPHSVQLAGIADNCAVSGDNPQAVTVTAGETVTVAFAVACTSPSPNTGGVRISATTTGGSIDPDGYRVSVDGGTQQDLAVNGSRTIQNLAPGSHSVSLGHVAPNCTVATNPQTVTIAAGETATLAFTVACTAPSPTTGGVRISAITTGGSIDPNGYSVTVDGGTPQDLAVNGNRTIQNLAPGPHSVSLGNVAANCTVTANPQTVAIVAGQTAALEFRVSCVAAGPSVNFRIEGMYLTQSTQELAGDVPLVEGRDGYLRVFVTASGANNVRPEVRVRFFRGGTVAQTLTIPSTGGSTPTAVQEGTLQSSWNVRVPASFIQANTAILADVDPANALAETSETDNSYPASGAPRALSVQTVPAAAITFIPIRQSADNSVGQVNNSSQLLDLPRRMYPLDAVTGNVGQEFTISGPLTPLDDNGEWVQAVTDLEGRRVEAGATDRTYIGLVRLNYGPGFGTVGIGFNTPGTSSAIATDAPSDVRETVAHELGHTFGMLHTPCGTPPSVDRNYPYSGGRIGVYGLDVASATLKLPSQPDIMGYCENPWISDYTYQKVLSYRRANPLQAGGAPQPSLLVWGHIRNGQAVLEPVFRIVTRPHLPTARGPYTVEATASDGSSVFSLSFDAQPIPDDPQGSRHFVFAVPLDDARAMRLGSLRLTGPGIQVSALTQSAGRLRNGAGTDAVTAEAEPGAVRLKWDAAVHPMIMVRDPDTGEVLSFARGGNARVWTSKGAVDLELSDGVQSQRLRSAINR